jgi:glycosyltransferase involved in cell wall biosynthesis
MNVLMVNHPAAERFHGGDLVQMRKTAEALRFYGVRVTESFEPEPSPTGFDLVHVFNLRTAQDTLSQLIHLKAFGIPVVLSPLYLDPAIGLWGSRAVTGFAQDDRSPEVLERRLLNLRDRNVSVTVPDGAVYTAHAPNRPYANCDRDQRAALQLVDFLVVNSTLEFSTLMRTLRVTHLPHAVAHVGIDPSIFRYADPEPFVRRYDRRDFVLQVGRIESPKNQLLLAIACRQARLPLVLIGNAQQPQYLEWVRKHGPEDLLVIPHLPQEELGSAYAAARVHVLPSWAETCGLVNLEAAMSGAAVVAGILGYETEYLADLAYYCDPASVESIREAVVRAWEEYPRMAERRSELRLRIENQFTWQRSAAATHDAYCRVLAKR